MYLLVHALSRETHEQNLNFFLIIWWRNLFSHHCSPCLAPAGWGEMPAVHTKSEASWGEPSSPSAAVDNGTSAWGKPPSSGTGWGENPAEPAGTYGRTNAPAAAPALCKPGTHRGFAFFIFWFSLHFSHRSLLCHFCFSLHSSHRQPWWFHSQNCVSCHKAMLIQIPS